MSDERRERLSYLIGGGGAALLSALAFATVALGLDRTLALWLIGLLAIAQIVLQLRYFLHIDLSRQKREDLQLILFSALLLTIMAGGTIWILADQAARMM